MFPYLALLVAFSATLVGIYGETISKQRRLTRNGWIALSIASIGLLIGGALQIRSDLAESERERRNRRLQGVALIQLQEAVNEHVTLWRNLKEDGWDPGFFGDTMFELPNFLRDEVWQAEVNAQIPDHLAFRRSYQSLHDRTIETLLLYRDVIDPGVLVATSKFRRQPMAEYFITWSPGNPLPDWSLGRLASDVRSNPIDEVIRFAATLHSKYQNLKLPETFEEEHREIGQVKDDKY